MDTLSLAIVAHLVGDYLLQNDWMATGKKQRHWICSVHVIAYLIPFLFLPLSWLSLVLIGIQHWLQDRWGFVGWYFKHSGKEAFSKPPMAPWSWIVVDNVFHLAWIVIVIAYLK